MWFKGAVEWKWDSASQTLLLKPAFKMSFSVEF